MKIEYSSNKIRCGREREILAPCNPVAMSTGAIFCTQFTTNTGVVMYMRYPRLLRNSPHSARCRKLNYRFNSVYIEDFLQHKSTH